MIYLIKNQDTEIYALKKCGNLRSANFYINTHGYKVISALSYFKYWFKAKFQ